MLKKIAALLTGFILLTGFSAEAMARGHHGGGGHRHGHHGGRHHGDHGHHGHHSHGGRYYGYHHHHRGRIIRDIIRDDAAAADYDSRRRR